MIEFSVQYLLCFIDSFITFWCFRYIASHKISTKKILFHCIFYALINYYLNYMVAYHSILFSFNALIVINIIWLSLLFREKLLYTIIFAFFNDVIISITYFTCSFLFIQVFQATWQSITIFSYISVTHDFLFECLYFITLYYLIRKIKKIINPIQLQKDRYLLLYVFIPSLAFNFLFDILHFKIPIRYIMVNFILLTIMFAFTSLLYNRIIQVTRENDKQAMILQDISYTEEYLEEVQSNQKELRKIKHDLQNQIIIMKEMLGNKQYEHLNQYLNDLQVHIAVHTLASHSGNIYVDALINHKVAQFPHIQFDLKISELNDCLQIDEFTFCSLLGNLFDNAIEATQQTNEKWVFFRCIVQDNLISINMKNPILDISDLKTHKQHQEDHGLGLEIINTIVSNHEGSLDIIQDNHIFDISISMSNSNQS